MKNLFDNKFWFMINCSTQPSEIDNMYYYEYVELVKRLDKYLKEKNKNEQTSEDSASKKYKNYKPKIPNFRKMKM